MVALRPGKDRIGGRSAWECQCDCGATTFVETRLLSGRTATKSCGCTLAEKNRLRPVRNATNLTHGESGNKRGPRSSEYVCWLSMRQRCNDANHANFPLYGGRGIRVCALWDVSFEAFLADMGRKPRPRMTIDRIDPNLGYEPSNCRWASYAVQGSNRRNNAFVVVSGKKMTCAEASRETGIPEKTIHGWRDSASAITDLTNKVMNWKPITSSKRRLRSVGPR